MVKYIFIKSPDEWATTKQACRDKRVVRLNLFLYLIHTYIHTLYIHIYTYIHRQMDRQTDRGKGVMGGGGEEGEPCVI